MAVAAPKIDPELLARCREAGIPVDGVIDEALRTALRKLDTSAEDARAAKWKRDSGDAMAEYNRRVEANKKG